MIIEFLMEFKNYLIEILPYLAIGFLLSGLIYEFVPTQLVEEHLGTKRDKAPPLFYSCRDSIARIELYGAKKNGQIIDLGRAAFAPTYTNPNVRFQVSVGEFEGLCALAYYNIHGLR